jgi:hypothetical protein
MQPERIQRALTAYEFRRRKAKKRIDVLAVIRLLLFLVLVIAGSLSFGTSVALPAGILAGLSLIAFVYTLMLHEKWYRSLSRMEAGISMLQKDLARREVRLKDLREEPTPVFEPEHPFAKDLDFNTVFSVLRLIDNTFHQQARNNLARWMNHIDQPEVIRARQQAVAELAPRRGMRRKLYVASHNDSQETLDPQQFKAFLAMKTPWTGSFLPWLLGRILAVITTGCVIGYFFFQLDTPWIWMIMLQLTLNFIFDFWQRGFIDAFMQRGGALRACATVVPSLLRMKPKSEYLADLQKVWHKSSTPADQALSKSVRIFDQMSYRSNGFAYLFLNGLFLWDQHQVRQLSLWRAQHQEVLPDWVTTIFEIEALSALANYADLFPQYPFPELVESYQIVLEAKHLGHPCIPESERVGNDYQIQDNGNLHLVTGSNMSGKSTFLRSLGVNLILARMGAPVCATSLRCNLPHLWTSIRIEDSLEAGVSYFYAEVRRLKAILDAVEDEDGRPVFYLLDEILRGTNSRERLIACRALIRYLVSKPAAGLITTHDLELIDLVDEHPESMVNYHFQESVKDEAMYFDYKLKPGRLEGTNALRVMQLAGINLDFENEG